jgi:hypothetical protein
LKSQYFKKKKEKRERDRRKEGNNGLINLVGGNIKIT